MPHEIMDKGGVGCSGLMRAKSVMNHGNNAKIIFWGTSEFAIPALEVLLQHGYHVAAVITNPDEPKGRKQIITPPPVKAWILGQETEKSIQILQPEKVGMRKLELEVFNADVFIVAAYGKIIPKEILDIPACGALNIHPSLLPRWRGPSPIQHTILAGDTDTGITIIKMDEKVDHGPVVAMRQLEIRNQKSEIRSKPETQNSKITYRELHDTLARGGAELLVDTLPKWLSGNITPVPQDESKATYSKMLKKEDGKIDWKKPSVVIERQICAFEEWPGSYTFWRRGESILQLEIEAADASDKDKAGAVLGEVWQDGNRSLLIQTGAGSIRVLQLKCAGKKSSPAAEFLNGYKDIVGATLG